MHCFHLLRSCL